MTADENRRAATVDLLAWLVQQESTTGTPGETAALRAVADRLRSEAGQRALVQVSRTADACVLRPVDTDRPVLLFACHIDTVPAGDAALWTRPPLSAVVEDGVLYGRGSSDMKSGLATSMIAVLEAIDDGAPVALVVTTGEEAGCLGAPAAARLLEGLEVGAVVIPESTGNQVALGHRGAYWLTVATTGVAAHGSTPERGRNAVLALAATLGSLDELPLRSHPRLGAESVNVGVFSGGDVHNIVPAHAHAAIDHRITDLDVSALRTWWAARVDDVRVDLALDPVWSAAEDLWIASLPAKIATDPVPYFTDASILVRHLPARTPIAIWGPGDPTTVHGVDEHVELTAVDLSLEMFRTAIADWQSPRR